MEVPQRLADVTHALHSACVGRSGNPSHVVVRQLDPELRRVAALVAGQDATVGPDANGRHGHAEPCCRHSQGHEPVRSGYPPCRIRGTCCWNARAYGAWTRPGSASMACRSGSAGPVPSMRLRPDGRASGQPGFGWRRARWPGCGDDHPCRGCRPGTRFSRRHSRGQGYLRPLAPAAPSP